MDKISVIIPLFNQVHLTQRCFKSIIEGAKGPQELIVIDNHSTDDTPSYLVQFKKEAETRGWKIQIITNAENVGVSRAWNQGLKIAEGNYIGIANNDTWLMPGWDEVCLRRIKELNAAMVGAYYDETPFDETLTPLKAQKFVTRNKNKVSRWWSPIFMVYDRNIFSTLGFFDERYFVSYEDRDFRERMDRQNLKYYTIADCYIWHFSKGTRSQVKLPPKYEEESLQKFMEKWGFDPRLDESKKIYRYKRKWTKFKNKWGFF